MEEEAPQEQETLTAPYSIVPRLESTVKADQRLTEVQNWLETLKGQKELQTQNTRPLCTIAQNSLFSTIDFGTRTQKDNTRW